MKTALAAISLAVSTSAHAAPLYVGKIGDGLKASVYAEDITIAWDAPRGGRIFTQRVTAPMARQNGPVFWNTTDVRYHVFCDSLQTDMMYSNSYFGRKLVYNQIYAWGQYSVIPPRDTEMYKMVRAVCDYQPSKAQKEPK